MDSQRYYDKVGKNGENEREIARFEKTLPHLLNEGTLLDVGCGKGYWLDFLKNRTSLKLIGSDISPIRIGLSKDNLKNSNISLIVGDIQNLPCKSDLVEQATALEVLEHVPDWKLGLDQLVRVAKNRVVVTVPYNEKLKYETCKNCGEKAFLYGHLHSFTERNFEEAGFKTNAKFKKIQPAFGLEHYVSRAIKGVISRAKAMTETSTEKGHPLCTVCPNCYEEVPYKKYLERSIQRLARIITKQPEYLLVRIDK